MLRTPNHWQPSDWTLLRTDVYSAKQCLKILNSSTQNILIFSLLPSKAAMRFNLPPLNLTHWKASYHKTSIISAVSITKRKWSVRSPLYFSKFQATCSANKWKTYKSEMFCPRHYHKSKISHRAKLKKLPSSNTPQVITRFSLAIVRYAAKVPPFPEIFTFLILNFYSRHCKGNMPVFSP